LPTVGALAREDVATCGLGDAVGDVRRRVGRSPYPSALGRLRASMLDCDPRLPAEDVMEPGPKTVRPNRSPGTIAAELAEKDLRWVIVTTPEGRLLGIAARADLERAK